MPPTGQAAAIARYRPRGLPFAEVQRRSSGKQRLPYTIAIAGCGVAGLTAGLLLARQGHAVSIFEQSPQVGPAGAGVLLQPSGQLVLQRIGLLDQVVARAQRIDRLVGKTHRGHTLVDLPYGAVAPDLHAYGLHRGDLFSVLHAQSIATGVKIVLNTHIARFTERAQSIEPIDHQNVSCGNFDVLLAADGSRSELRGNSGLHASVYEYPHGALWAMGKHSSIGNQLFQVTHGTRLLCGLLPMGDNRCSLFWSLRKDEKEALFAGDFADWKQQVLSLAPEAEELLAGLRGFEQTRFTTYQHVRMLRWRRGRFLLLGDAAHSMSPHLGQGINLALLDGYVIAAALASTRTPQHAFARYEQLRRAHTSYYGAVTFMLSPFFQSRGVLKGWMRDLFLPLLPHLPIVRSQMLLTMTGLKQSYLKGRIELPKCEGRGGAVSPNGEGGRVRPPYL